MVQTFEFNIPKDKINIDKTFNCGQCFRFEPFNDGYIGTSANNKLFIKQTNDKIILNCDDLEFWTNYLDLNNNYDEYIKNIKLDLFAEKSYNIGKGIKILNQDLFEMIITFIISQRNSMTRIKNTMNKICKYGNCENFMGKDIYYFPTYEQISKINLSDLKLGYREEYVKNAIDKILTNTFDLSLLKNMNTNECLKYLKTLNGIGDKVASCIALFGLHKLDVFPIDIWMKRIIDEEYNGKIDISNYQPYAGLIQQYMFYYKMNNKK